MPGRFQGTIEKTDGGIKVNGNTIKVFQETDAAKIPWGSVGADYIAECTGVFCNKETAGKHLQDGLGRQPWETNLREVYGIIDIYTSHPSHS